MSRRGKSKLDPIGPAEVQILPNDAFKKMPPLDGTVENLGQTDFELTDRDAMIEAGGPVLGTQRPGQAMGPPVKKLLQIAGAELATDRFAAARDRRTRGSRCRDW